VFGDWGLEGAVKLIAEDLRLIDRWLQSGRPRGAEVAEERLSYYRNPNLIIVPPGYLRALAGRMAQGPEEGGKAYQELLARARALEGRRGARAKADPYFGAALQIVLRNAELFYRELSALYESLGPHAARVFSAVRGASERMWVNVAVPSGWMYRFAVSGGIAVLAKLELSEELADFYRRARPGEVPRSIFIFVSPGGQVDVVKLIAPEVQLVALRRKLEEYIKGVGGARPTGAGPQGLEG